MATDDATGDSTVAAVFRAALSLGIATPADLVPWADGQVMARERPAAWIIDLSLGAAVPVDQMAVTLGEVVFPAVRPAVFRLFVGLVDPGSRSTYRTSRRAAAAWLYQVASHYADDDAAFSRAAAIDDEFDRAELRLNTGDAVCLTGEVSASIRDYADPAARAWLPGVRVTFAG